MKTNTPHLPKTNSPDSDETARAKHPYSGDEADLDVSADIEGLQTSNKTGKHSSVEKLAASRPEFGTSPGAHHVDGAFGDDLKEDEDAAASDAEKATKWNPNGA
jgi:hypothetical protein